MAYNAGKIKLTVTYQDNTAKPYNKSYEINTAHPDLADLETMVTTGKTTVDVAVDLLGARTQAKVLSYSASQEFVNDAGGTGAGDWDDKAVVSCLLNAPDEPGKRANVYINAPDTGIFVGDGAFGPESETIDPADTGLLAFLALWATTTASAPTPSGLFLISDGESMLDAPAPKGRKL